MSTEREAMTLEQALDWLITMKDRGLLRDGIDDHDANAIILSISAHLAREKAEPVATVCLVGDRYALGRLVEVQLQLASKDAPNPKIGDRYYTHPTAPAEADERPLECRVMPELQRSEA